MRRYIPAITGGLLLVSVSAVPAQTLRGSRVAMQRQHTVARQQDYTFLNSPAQVRKFVSLGLLVPISETRHLELASVSHPFARPALKTFVLRLSAQYHAACGERLVITSLTRPTSEQPHNASDLSVHPAGMAVDLRVSNRASCQRWLQKTLLSLEQKGVLDATRERRPPHFHVAIFPEKYEAYVARLGGSSGTKLAAREEEPLIVAGNPSPAARAAVAGEGLEKYRVSRGDTLWGIARRFGTTVKELKSINKLRSSRIAAGQVISVPVGTAAP